MLSFQRKLRTEQRNVILEKIYKKTTWFEPCCLLQSQFCVDKKRRQDNSNAENLVQRIHADNMVQKDKMGWNTNMLPNAI